MHESGVPAKEPAAAAGGPAVYGPYHATFVTVLNRPPVRFVIGLALLITVLFVTSAIWAVVGRLDTFAVLEGQIVPAGGVKPIKAPLNGIVKTIHVENGDRVAKGDPVITFDPIERAAERARMVGEWEATRAKRDRLQATVAALNTTEKPLSVLVAELRGVGMNLRDHGSREVANGLGSHTPRSQGIAARETRLLIEELAAYAAVHAAVLQELEHAIREREAMARLVKVRRSRADLLRRRVDMVEKLLAAQAASTAQLLGHQISLAEAEAEAMDVGHRLTVLDGKVAQLSMRAKTQRLDLIRRLAREYTDAAAKADSLAEQVRQVRHRAHNIILRAPATGIVEHVSVMADGEFAELAKPLLIVVPDGPRFEVEAAMQTKDRGFVRTGQTARIKLEGVPFGRAEILEGTVTRVARYPKLHPSRRGDETNATPRAAYQVKIALDQRTVNTPDGPIDLVEGMAARVEVRTGERTIFEYLTDQWRAAADTALRER